MRSLSVLNKPQGIPIRVPHIHFPVAPCLIRGFEINGRALRRKLRVQCVHIVHNQIGYAPETPSPENEDTCNHTPSREMPI